MMRGRIRLRRILPLFFFVTSLVQAAPPSETPLLLEAFDFLEADGDLESLKVLSDRIVQDHADEASLLSKVIEWHIRRRDRPGLQALFEGLATRNRCNSLKAAKSCLQFRKLWQNNLDSLIFYETTAGQLEKLRRMIAAQDCAPALPVLKGIIAKEGAFRPALELAEKAYRCAGREEDTTIVLLELDRLRIFSSAL
jgi:hypothetical protein